MINVIDVANEDVDKPLIVFNDSINEVEWRDSDYGKVFHVPNSHIISLIFRSEKTMCSLGITEDSLAGFLLPRQSHRSLGLNSDVLEAVCKAKFIYKDNVCIKVDSYEKFCSFINNSLLIMISNYSNNMNEITMLSNMDIDVMKQVTDLSNQLKQQKQYTNLSSCSLQCNICYTFLKNEKEARDHAKLTGHQNFVQAN